MTYDIIDRCSIRPAVALGSPRCGSGLTATLPRLCRPEPALAETLAPSASAMDTMRERPRPYIGGQTRQTGDKMSKLFLTPKGDFT